MNSKVKKLDIILYGGPASGKSTQAELLVKKIKSAHMNMGKLLRNALADKHPDYKKIEKYMQAGKLVPEIVSTKLVKDFLKNTPKSKRIVFDGYPRRMKQVKIIEPILNKLDRQVVMIFVDLPTKVAKARIKKRAAIENRVDDAKDSVVSERIKVFKTQAQNILDHYKKQKALVKINGDQSIEAIHRDIVKAIQVIDGK